MVTTSADTNSTAKQQSQGLPTEQSGQFEVHDAAALARRGRCSRPAAPPRQMGSAVVAAVERNAAWRGRECINLLAPEAPTSPGVRALLAAEVGTRAAEGHIGAANRWFAGTRHIDEVEALCVELLKRCFRSRYADHRLCASMIGNVVVYTALAEPGDIIMSAPQPFGGHSSNRPRRAGRRARPHDRRRRRSTATSWSSTSTPSARRRSRCGRSSSAWACR